MKGSSALEISGDMPIRKPSGMATSTASAKPSSTRAAANRRAGCRCPCRWGRCRRTGRADGPRVVRRRRAGRASRICPASTCWPISSAYSGSTFAPPCRRRCVADMPAAPGRAARIASDRTSARRLSDGAHAPSAPLDREARRGSPRASPDRRPCPSPRWSSSRGAGGVSPTSVISLAASVARKTCSAIGS